MEKKVYDLDNIEDLIEFLVALRLLKVRKANK
jgi:hypothetical protein